MGIVSFWHYFSRTPGSSTSLTPLRTQLGLFGPTASGLGNGPEKAGKRGGPRKLAMGSGLHIYQIGKKDTSADAHVNSSLKKSLSRLKIVRQFEPGASSLCAGRMTISGRMADVCAELDRMAQSEAVSCHNVCQ